MNVPKIKGTHNAMKSGIMAADSSLEALRDGSKPGRVDNECCHDTGICVCVCVRQSVCLPIRLSAFCPPYCQDWRQVIHIYYFHHAVQLL